MTPYDIERKTARMLCHLESKLLAGELSQADYDLGAKDIHDWCEAQYNNKDTWQSLGNVAAAVVNCIKP
jgi:hypothetical protein